MSNSVESDNVISSLAHTFRAFSNFKKIILFRIKKKCLYVSYLYRGSNSAPLLIITQNSVYRTAQISDKQSSLTLHRELG